MMLSVCSRSCVKFFSVNLFRKYLTMLNQFIKQDNYSCYSNHRRKPNPFSNFTKIVSVSVIHYRLKHNQSEGKKNFNDLENFLEILKSNDGTGDDVSRLISTFSTIKSQLKKVYLEDHHLEKLKNFDGFKKLVSEAEKSFDKLSLKDSIDILRIFTLLTIPISDEFHLAIKKKIQNNIQNMDLEDKIYFRKFFVILLREKADSSIMGDLNRKIIEDLKRKSFVNSSNCVIALLDYTSFKSGKVHLEDALLNLKLISRLKKWNDETIYKEYLNVLNHVPEFHQSYVKLREIYFRRIKKEISEFNDAYLICLFLLSYAETVVRNPVLAFYDCNLVDDCISRILREKLNTRTIKSLCVVLSKIKHSNYDFTNSLIDSIQENPQILSSHPDLSRKLISTIARSNCNHENINRFDRIKPILENSSHLIEMLNLFRKDLRTYIYTMFDLFSLEIFIDEEIKRFAHLINYSNNLSRQPLVILRFLLLLHQSLKLLHPNCPHEILNSYLVEKILNKCSRTDPSGNYLMEIKRLKQMRKYLSVESNQNQNMLIKCETKLGFSIDGVLGVTVEGRFFNFGELLDKGKKIYVEDISLPKGYNPVSIMLVYENEHSRNTLDLYPARALGLKISEKLGFQTVIIYEKLFSKVETEMKGSYLCSKIQEKIESNR